MEFAEDFIKQQGLSAEQVTAITSNVTNHYDTHIAEEKKGWDDKANKDAQGILDGATNKIVELTSVARNDKEKAAEYIDRAWATFSKDGLTALEASKKEYDDKVTNFEGDSNLKAELITLKEKIDPLQKKEADYDALLNSGVKDKYDTLVIEHKDNLRAVAFGGVKPSFHKDANEFEVSAQWSAFIKEVEEKHNVVLVDGEAIAIDKNNEHKRVPLKDLVKDNEVLTKLINGRQQEGLPTSQSSENRDIEGVPFAVPQNADDATITKLIYGQLEKENLEKFGESSGEWTDRFAELNRKVRAA